MEGKVQGCIKLPFPPPGGNRIKLFGKKIKLGRREGEGKLGRGREDWKGEGRWEGEGKGK